MQCACSNSTTWYLDVVPTGLAADRNRPRSIDPRDHRQHGSQNRDPIEHHGSVLSAVSVLDDVLSVVSEVCAPEFCLLSGIRKHLVHRNRTALMAKLNKPVSTTQANHAHIVSI